MCLKRYLHFCFHVPAGAMEESSEGDDDSNVQDEIKKNITDIYFFVKFGLITPSELKAYLQHSAIFGLFMHLSANVHP